MPIIPEYGEELDEKLQAQLYSTLNQAVSKPEKEKIRYGKPHLQNYSTCLLLRQLFRYVGSFRLFSTSLGTMKSTEAKPQITYNQGTVSNYNSSAWGPTQRRSFIFTQHHFLATNVNSTNPSSYNKVFSGSLCLQLLADFPFSFCRLIRGFLNCLFSSQPLKQLGSYQAKPTSKTNVLSSSPQNVTIPSQKSSLGVLISSPRIHVTHGWVH